MAAIVSLHGVSATWTGRTWRAADATIALLLDATLPEQRGDDPHFAQTVAEAARDGAGAAILHVDAPEPADAGVIF